MVDTWATVGSCAQIGTDVHLSGGVGIGGVLEPLQASPVIVEDGAFVGSRCIVVEGVRVGREAVLGANVVLTASTPIIDVRGKEPVELRGEVPAARDRHPRHAQEEVPGRLLPHPVRAHHRRAQRLDRPQDLTDRGAARARGQRLRLAASPRPTAASRGRSRLGDAVRAARYGWPSTQGQRRSRREDRHRPARQVDVEVLPDLDLELAAVELDRDRRVAAAQDVGDGRAARAGAAGGGLADPALEDPRADGGVVERGEPRDVGALRELRVGLDRRADGGEVERLEGGRVGDVDRRLRVADDEVLEVEAVGLAGVARASARPMSTRQVVSERIVGRISPAAVWIENWRASVQPARRR